MVFTTPKVSTGGGKNQHETKGKGKKRFEMLLASMGNKHKDKRVHSIIQINPGTDPSTSVFGKKYLKKLQISNKLFRSG